MNKIIYVIFIFFSFTAQNMALAQEENGEIMGKVVDFETGEAIPFAHVFLELNGKIAGAQTDFHGFYSIKPLPIGTYHINIQMYEYEKLSVLDVPVFVDSITVLHVLLASDSLDKSREMTYQAPTVEDLLNFKKFIKKNTRPVTPTNCYPNKPLASEKKRIKRMEWQRAIEQANLKTNNRYIYTFE